MFKHNKIVCVIPARGGSKRLPGKNIKELLGKPLIAYTIEQAKSSKYIDRIIVSTDSKKIAEVSRLWGAEVPYIRPESLARDTIGTLDVLLHAIDWLEKKGKYFFEILVLLHVTTPLRKTEDIDKAIEILLEEDADNVFSVTEAHRNPYFNMVEMDPSLNVKLVKRGNFVTRQSAPRVFDMNSSIYVWWKDILKTKKSICLKKSRLYFMPKERSIDIDDTFDFKIAEFLLRENLRK